MIINNYLFNILDLNLKKLKIKKIRNYFLIFKKIEKFSYHAKLVINNYECINLLKVRFELLFRKIAKKKS